MPKGSQGPLTQSLKWLNPNEYPRGSKEGTQAGKHVGPNKQDSLSRFTNGGPIRENGSIPHIIIVKCAK